MHRYRFFGAGLHRGRIDSDSGLIFAFVFDLVWRDDARISEQQLL
jgi:hypothetical protein